METKQQARIECINSRKRQKPRQIRSCSEKICQRIAESDFFRRAEVVYFYYPKGEEVSLLALAQQAISLGKQAAFPKTAGTGMEFYRVNSLEEFEPGGFGVMEPKGGEEMSEPSPLVLVPGVGFDRAGNRMGYGKGYYDRYLARFPGAYKVGIAYECQMADKIPADAYDIPMDLVMTETASYGSAKQSMK